MTKLTASHGWFTRAHFPFNGDAEFGQYIVHFNDPSNVESLVHDIAEMLGTFYKEIGIEIGKDRAKAPEQMEKGRFYIEGPKGFSIIEITPGFNQEEFDKINQGEEIKLDVNVWGSVFGANLPEEKDAK